MRSSLWVERSGDGSAAPQPTAYRAWFRELFTGLAARGGACHPAVPRHQLHLLYDGAVQSGNLDHGPAVATAARSAALILGDAAVG